MLKTEDGKYGVMALILIASGFLITAMYILYFVDQPRNYYLFASFASPSILAIKYFPAQWFIKRKHDATK